jgi:hypothetical protein
VKVDAVVVVAVVVVVAEVEAIAARSISACRTPPKEKDLRKVAILSRLHRVP